MNILKFLINYLEKSKVIIYLVAIIIIWAISMYLPIMNGKFIDVLLEGTTESRIYYILLTISLLSVLSIILTYFSNILKIKIVSKTNFKISYHLLDHIKKLPISFFYNQNPAYLSQRINMDATNLSDFALNKVINFIFNIFSLILSIFILININIKISSILILLIPVYISLYFIFKKKLYTLNYKSKENQNLYFGAINSQLENIKFIKFNSLNYILNENLKKKFNIAYESIINITKASNMFSNSGVMITVIANIFILLLAINQILNGELSIGQFTIISTYFNRVISSIEYCLSFLESYQNTLVSYCRIQELFNLKKDINGNVKIKHIDRILIENLSFKYCKKQIITKFNAEFKKGFIYRIVGDNGAGKSSLLTIIAGLYNNNYIGTIKYNENNILDLDMYNTRKNLIGVVEQEPTLLNDSIINNLTYNLDNYDLNKLEYLLKQFNLNNFISKLENGLDTNILEKSFNISGGEKQKIGLIRTLLKNPDVIILDEANSALDIDSKINLSSILKKEKKDKIIVLVSHSDTFDEIVDFNIELKITS